ncbi:MAG TPA: hypothetical protein VFZ16_14830 [Hyphomicrobiaceae bacterium]|nr:hypothetical protein [Hyphomicrobiaceae bacterium]
MARQNRLPVAVAVVLTMAAAVSIADEHMSSLAAAERMFASFDSGARMVDGKPGETTLSAKRGHAGKARNADDAAAGGGGRAKHPSGVGSRALLGNDDAPGQP